VDQRDILFNDCGDRVATLLHLRPKSGGVSGRGLHSFPFPLNLNLLCPFPLNLSLLCPPCKPT
jgi:hypothetical protein